MLKILDTIKQANEESIDERYQRWRKEQEYECYSCGKFSHMDCATNMRIWRDQQSGDEMNELICDRCLELGWDEWGR